MYAHNANFDFGHLHAASDLSGVPMPNLVTACGLTLSRRLLDLVSHRLPFITEHFGFDATGHHQAANDSTMAAHLVQALAETAGADNVTDLCEAARTRPGRFGPDSLGGMVIRRRSTAIGFDTPDTNTEADPNHPPFGEWVSFTGGLTAFTREPVCTLLATLGANPQPKGVNKKTTMLVIGDGFTSNSLEDFTTKKVLTALKLRSKGQSIEVFAEDDFSGSSTSTPQPRERLHAPTINPAGTGRRTGSALGPAPTEACTRAFDALRRHLRIVGSDQRRTRSNE